MNRKQYIVVGVVFNIISLPIYIATAGIHGDFFGVVLSILFGGPAVLLSVLALIPALRYQEDRGLYGLKLLFLYALVMLALGAAAWPLAIGASCVLGMCVDAIFYERKMKAQGIDIHAKPVIKDKFKKM